MGRGMVTSIDCNPELPEWVSRTFDKVDPALREHHELVISPTSYNDELMKVIASRTRDTICQPFYDFCFIDGAHTFFLCEKLVRPGKWILFDDMSWTIAGSAEAQEHLKGKKPIPSELQQTAQVGKVFELLVAQHSGFECLTIHGDWGWARKRQTAEQLAIPNTVIDLERVCHFPIRKGIPIFREQSLGHQRSPH
jgi:hypothetical protein